FYMSHKNVFKGYKNLCKPITKIAFHKDFLPGIPGQNTIILLRSEKALDQDIQAVAFKKTAETYDNNPITNNSNVDKTWDEKLVDACREAGMRTILKKATDLVLPKLFAHLIEEQVNGDIEGIHLKCQMFGFQVIEKLCLENKEYQQMYGIYGLGVIPESGIIVVCTFEKKEFTVSFMELNNESMTTVIPGITTYHTRIT
ncbi:hypothetical protein Ciccas_007467, partial [Cichlidogyrus casuarinus]